MSREPGYRELLSARLDGVTLDLMVRYAELLEKWSARHNLVKFSGRRELVERHLFDSLAGVHLLEGAGRLLDLGSGAGLPGVPLLTARPRWTGVLLEPRQKRWAFLKMVVRELGLEARALDCRYQELPPGEAFDLVTSRAVGNHNEILAWAEGRLNPTGGVVFWTTTEGERALAEEPGWRVLSWPLVGLDRGRLTYLRSS
jgi:16S rRNA (guanine527-N7)-methyltransferase